MRDAEQTLPPLCDRTAHPRSAVLLWCCAGGGLPWIERQPPPFERACVAWPFFPFILVSNCPWFLPVRFKEMEAYILARRDELTGGGSQGGGSGKQGVPASSVPKGFA